MSKKNTPAKKSAAKQTATTNTIDNLIADALQPEQATENPTPSIDENGNLQLQIPSIEIEDSMEVLGSKRFIKGGMEFKAPEEILRPVIDLLANTGGKLILTATNEQNNANTDGSVNRSFGRLNLICKYAIDSDMWYEIGVLIAFDLQIPKIKVYRGPKVAACLNLCVFGAEDVVKFDLSAGVNIEQVTTYIQKIAEHMEECIETVNRFKALRVQPEAMERIIGSMLMTTIKEEKANGTTAILRAAEYLTDPKSKYFYEQKDFNGWLLYNAFTEYFGKGNFFDIPEKSRDTFEMLNRLIGE